MSSEITYVKSCRTPEVLFIGNIYSRFLYEHFSNEKNKNGLKVSSIYCDFLTFDRIKIEIAEIINNIHKKAINSIKDIIFCIGQNDLINLGAEEFLCSNFKIIVNIVKTLLPGKNLHFVEVPPIGCTARNFTPKEFDEERKYFTEYVKNQIQELNVVVPQNYDTSKCFGIKPNKELSITLNGNGVRYMANCIVKAIFPKHSYNSNTQETSKINSQTKVIAPNLESQIPNKDSNQSTTPVKVEITYSSVVCKKDSSDSEKESTKEIETEDEKDKVVNIIDNETMEQEQKDMVQVNHELQTLALKNSLEFHGLLLELYLLWQPGNEDYKQMLRSDILQKVNLMLN